jgi:hypothetical protein
MFRDQNNLKKLPNIQAQVIGYGFAQRLFMLIQDGEKANASWKGALNINYTYGGKLSENKYKTSSISS